MKTSNKILLLFFGCVTCYMIAAFVDIRVNGQLNSLKVEKDRQSIPVDPSIKYLLVRDMPKQITIETNSRTRIDLLTEKGRPFPTIDYRINGDTLIIDKLTAPEDESYASLAIYLDPMHLELIRAVNTSVKVFPAGLNELHLELEHSTAYIHGKDDSKIQHLRTKVVNKSRINTSRLSTDTLTVNMENSDAEIGYTQVLQGSLSNHSVLTVKSAGELAIKIDKSSQLHHRK